MTARRARRRSSRGPIPSPARKRSRRKGHQSTSSRRALAGSRQRRCSALVWPGGFPVRACASRLCRRRAGQWRPVPADACRDSVPPRLLRYLAGDDSDSDSDDGKRVVRSAKVRTRRHCPRAMRTSARASRNMLARRALRISVLTCSIRPLCLQPCYVLLAPVMQAV